MSVHNPGTFTPRRIKGPREIAGMTARQVLAGHLVNAGALGIAESTNWLIAHIGKSLRPRVRCSCCGHEASRFSRCATAAERRGTRPAPGATPGAVIGASRC